MRASELYPVERQRARRAARSARGSRYVWRTPPVLVVIAITAVVGGLGFNFRVLLPVLASETLHASAAVFGALFASFGVGALVGALIDRGPRRRQLARALRRLGRLQRRADPARARRERRARGRAPLLRRALLLGLDVEQPVDHPAHRAGRVARPGARPLPVRLRRPGADRRPARRRARRHRRDGAGAGGRRRRGARRAPCGRRRACAG